MSETSILIVMPTRDRPDSGADRMAMRNGRTLADAGIHSYYEVIRGFGIEKARNQAVRLLRSSTATHLFFVDDDTTVPSDAVLRLLKLDADVATGVTPMLFGTRLTANVGSKALYSQNGRDAPDLWPEGVFEVDQCGLSCCLIKRDVFGKIGWPWFELHETEDGETMGEDVQFCRRVKAGGMRIVCDGSIHCGHIKDVDLAAFAPIAAGQQENGRVKRTFCVIGHSRSGTQYMAAMLSAYGWDIGHEQMGADGISSWMFAVPSVRHVPYTFDSSAPRDYLFSHIVHVVRNPLDCIASVVYIDAGSNGSLTPVEEYRIKYTGITRAASPLVRSVQSYIGWNRLCAARNPTTRIQIERAAELWDAFCADWPDLQRARVRDLPPGPMNARQHPRLTWDDLQEQIPSELYMELVEVAKDYGYNT